MNPRSLAAGICAGVAITSLLLTQAQAQIVSACAQTPRMLFPTYTDLTPGWAAGETVESARDQMIVGDIDGDGHDELIALPRAQNRIEVWRWSFTGWTPMAKFPSDLITTTQPGGYATQIHVADVDGDGQKELIVYVVGPQTTADQEQTYKYNPATAQWTLINTYLSGKADGRSYWFKAKPTDQQDTRLRFAATFMDIKRFQGGTWVSAPGDRAPIDRSSIAKCGTGLCVAMSDLDGNGFADFVYLATDAHVNMILSPANGQFFTGTPKISAIQAKPSGDFHLTYETWQMGDVDGDGKDELLFVTKSHFQTSTRSYDGLAVGAFYFDNGSMDFVAYPDSLQNLSVGQQAESLGGSPDIETMTILPRPIGSGGNMRGAVVLSNPSFLIHFQNNAGARSVGLVPLENSFNPNGEMGMTGYYGYFRLAVEQGGMVMLVRGPNGVLSEIEGRLGATSLFVNPNTYADRGYPDYSVTAQTTAYKYISAYATGNNPDIRSLYTEPATPWPAILQKVATMVVPATPSGIAAAEWTTDFKSVQNQTIAEITALQSVNELYGVTSRLLTNTYLVKDATLQEVTNVLSLPGQPDIGAQVLSNVTTALNGLGSLFYTIGGGLVLSNVTGNLEKIANKLGGAGSLSQTLGAITGDTSQYTANSAPDFSTGKYSLRLLLDNSALAAVTANSCHQLQSLSAWDQAKPLADGVTSGVVPLDLETQQDVLQASQTTFQVVVWQALAPSVWKEAGVQSGFIPQPFRGDDRYPAGYVQPGQCNVEGNVRQVGLVFENAATHNFPNPLALDALFKAPPDGLGAKADHVMLQKDGWIFPLLSANDLVPFGFNIGADHISELLLPVFCGANPTSLRAPNGISGAAAPVPAIQQSVISSAAPLVGRGRPTPPPAARTALVGLTQLRADLKANLQDAGLLSLLVMDLDVASFRLQHALKFQQEPAETLRLLNDVLTRLQFHATQGEADKDVSIAGVIKAVAVRDLLLSSDSPESQGTAQ